MLIEISGMQKAGKSTLIEGLTFNFNLYKFPMGPVCKHFCIKPTWEMQIAKDISTLEFYSQVVKLSEADDIPTISDRGPLSTIFYSILFNRTRLDNVKDFVKYLASNYPTDWKPVWVEGKNQPDTVGRMKNDGFDDLQTGIHQLNFEIAKNTMFNILNENHIQPTVFYNNFELGVEKSQENFNSCILEIYGDR